jgi:hypothetical protein
MSETKDTNHENIMEIDGRLTTHEAVCAERWKTIFNQIEGMEVRAGKRFDNVGESITRLETILISGAATGLLAAVGLIITHFNV